VSFQVFRKVEKQLPQLTTLDLQYVSPQLLKARDLDLAMPGMHLRFYFGTALYSFTDRNISEWPRRRSHCIIRYQAHCYSFQAKATATIPEGQ
jgi:hypothetical protein